MCNEQKNVIDSIVDTNAGKKYYCSMHYSGLADGHSGHCACRANDDQTWYT